MEARAKTKDPSCLASRDSSLRCGFVQNDRQPFGNSKNLFFYAAIVTGISIRTDQLNGSDTFGAC